MSQGSAPFLNLRLVWNTSPGRLLLCLITTSSLFMSYVPGAWKRALHCKEGPQFVFLHIANCLPGMGTTEGSWSDQGVLVSLDKAWIHFLKIIMKWVAFKVRRITSAIEIGKAQG